MKPNPKCCMNLCLCLVCYQLMLYDDDCWCTKLVPMSCLLAMLLKFQLMMNTCCCYYLWVHDTIATMTTAVLNLMNVLVCCWLILHDVDVAWPFWFLDAVHVCVDLMMNDEEWMLSPHHLKCWLMMNTADVKPYSHQKFHLWCLVCCYFDVAWCSIGHDVNCVCLKLSVWCLNIEWQTLPW